MTPPSDLDDPLRLVADYERGVASVVSRFLDDPRDIEEAVQDTFVQAWRNRERFRGEAAMFTWLYRIATNTALMRLRRRQATTVSVHELSAGDALVLCDDPFDGHPDRMVTVSEVRAALAALPSHHRIVVMLRDVDGYSNAEVATLLGLPVTTVKAQLHRARATLRRRLLPTASTRTAPITAAVSGPDSAKRDRASPVA